jgi:hypothetical protein
MRQRFNRATAFGERHRYFAPYQCGVAPFIALLPRLRINGKSVCSTSVAMRGLSTLLVKRLHLVTLHGRMSAGLVVFGALLFISILAILLFEMLRLDQGLLVRREIAAQAAMGP